MSDPVMQYVSKQMLEEAATALDTANAEIARLREGFLALKSNTDGERKVLLKRINDLCAALEKIADPLTLEVEGIGMTRALRIVKGVQEIAREALGK